jgi:hypothetical protein
MAAWRCPATEVKAGDVDAGADIAESLELLKVYRESQH